MHATLRLAAAAMAFAATSVTSGRPSSQEDSVPSALFEHYLEGQKKGEKSELPDYSHAGYRRCEEPVPRVTKRSHKHFDVTKYGAKPNDGRSDRKAVLLVAKLTSGGLEPITDRFGQHCQHSDRSGLGFIELICLSGTYAIGNKQDASRLFRGQQIKRQFQCLLDFRSIFRHDFRCQPFEIGQHDLRIFGKRQDTVRCARISDQRRPTTGPEVRPPTPRPPAPTGCAATRGTPRAPGCTAAGASCS